MALRLVLDIDGEILRIRLPVGDVVLGAAPDCGVRVPHFTVSRQHAVLRSTAGRVTVEDLGSSNGTLVGGHRIRGLVTLEPGQSIAFGSVHGVLEDIVDSEVEAAVAFPAGARSSTPAQSTSQPDTFSLGSLKAFALERLPELLRRLENGVDASTMAQLVGSALFDTLPCTEVEVVAKRDSHEGLAFSAVRTEPGAGDLVDASIRGGGTLRVRFLHSSQAKDFTPLVESCAMLISLAVPLTLRESRPATRAGIPDPPDPPTVVAKVKDLYRDAATVGGSEISVLISGESGTGKEVLARFIHAASKRADRPLAALNCAALPRDLLEAELFGVEEGVATGVTERPGKFESAHGGTLFLDEIGDMAAETQARILRVLQEGEVYRLGGRSPRPADVRVLSATNKNIDALIAAGTFRRDLFHRIADWHIVIPPLRRRAADIPNLAAHFLLEATAKRGLRAAGISRGAMETLERYSWPGNIRQLQREMARAALFLEEDELLETRHLQETIRSAEVVNSPTSLRQALEETEHLVIEGALARYEGDTVEAARHLGVSRSTLYRRMGDLGIRKSGQP